MSNKLPSEYRRVIRYSYAIAGISAISACLLVGSVVLQHQIETRARQHSDYHIHTIGLNKEITSQINRLKSNVTSQKDDGQEAQAAQSFTINRNIAIRTDAIKTIVDDMVHQHQKHGRTVTGASLQRIQNRLTRMEEAIRNAPTDSVLNALEAFEISIIQLSDLHTTTLQSELTEMSRVTAARTRLIIMGIAVVVVVTGLLVLRLFSLMRIQLKKHAEAEKVFLEQERMLQQSQKMEALGTLVGGVAHDFNNILTVILGHSEALQAEMDENSLDSTSANEVYAAGERAMELTRQLLAFSRYEMKKRDLLDLNLAIRDMHALLRRLVREDITLDVDLQPDVGRVRIDKVQLEQILMNMAANASQAMPDGGLLFLQTKTANVDPALAEGLGVQPGTFVMLRVEDSGTGIPPEVAAKVFDPFFTTKEPGEGTGLGLSTVHGIVAGCGGTIRVDSNPGRGTCFEIYLPQEKVPMESERKDNVQEESLEGTESILLVEDDVQVRSLTQKILEGKGYRVHVSDDGVEALCMFKENPEAYELILSDVVLPGLRGPDLMAHIHEIRPNIPFVFISGYSDPQLLHSVKITQAPLIPKPFKPYELLRIVRYHADQAAAKRESTEV